ncbi:hypothetical protein AGABI1DRAFT_88490 [Agaricus bisporus var. burnettii JB137-S8]|uniref:Uncharacterized protein n=1 Tax=Agaricus bisporus var. burnettii (strain JB137-S8 / ATCC MYA-4627 / FGSC 10392) TaxID=597362 RepID=K5X6L3_AGABU|nr:uncharacterized protein AGABI1DRAFT_88490 [Agaricus bisporus var. burnettii JB137-S8]EKM83526.1 hypothetical protein AGABI1DRAFT_88490 [Agaricus bisporus var. burnettii JB137-S8]
MSTKASRQQINPGSSRSYGKSVCKSEITPENVRKHGSATRENHTTGSHSTGEYLHAQDRNPITSTIYTLDNTQHLTSGNSRLIDKASLSPNLLTNWDDTETCSCDPRADWMNDKSVDPEPKPMPTAENADPVQDESSYFLPVPTSHKMLINNIRRTIQFKPRLNPPILIDYHEAYPQFQSTKSYNYLIDMAIRHTHFGTAQWLFDAMIHAGIPRNRLTRRLHVRWLVRTGRWEQAWTLATGLTPEEALDKPLRNGSAPLITKISCGLWEELLHTPKRSAFRQTKALRGSKYEVRTNASAPLLEIIKDPTPGTEAYLRRQHLLACVQPVIKLDKSPWMNPKVIKASIYSIVRDGRIAAATEVAKTYFSSLPADVNNKHLNQCLDIIHLLLSGNVENGTSSLVANRRLLLSLLKTHPSLKPSSKTLWLLLAPLKRAKKSGTIAFNVVKAFKESWGREIVDPFVRRRVINLAKKEGRKDIVQWMLDSDPHQPGVDEEDASVDITFHRPPGKELFARMVRDEWTTYRERASRGQDDEDSGDSDTLE